MPILIPIILNFVILFSALRIKHLKIAELNNNRKLFDDNILLIITLQMITRHSKRIICACYK